MKRTNLGNKCSEHEKGSMVGFAIAGLAIGVAAWYLLGTKQGRENLDRAVEGINEVSSKLQDKARQVKDDAASAIKSAKSKAEDLGEEAMHKGKEFVSDAEGLKDRAMQKGKEVMNDAEDVVNTAKSKAKDAADDVKSEVKK